MGSIYFQDFIIIIVFIQDTCYVKVVIITFYNNYFLRFICNKNCFNRKYALRNTEMLAFL